MYLEARSPESALLAGLPLGCGLLASAAPGAALLTFLALQPLVRLHNLQHSLSSVCLHQHPIAFSSVVESLSASLSEVHLPVIPLLDNPGESSVSRSLT